MELYQEILKAILLEEEIQITFPNLSIDPKELVESQCYQALKLIKAVLEDDTLDDDECFSQIEEFVCIFERMGVQIDARHDFG